MKESNLQEARDNSLELEHLVMSKEFLSDIKNVKEEELQIKLLFVKSHGSTTSRIEISFKNELERKKDFLIFLIEIDIKNLQQNLEKLGVEIEK